MLISARTVEGLSSPTNAGITSRILDGVRSRVSQRGSAHAYVGFSIGSAIFEKPAKAVSPDLLVSGLSLDNVSSISLLMP